MDSERVHVKFPGFRRPLFSGRFSRCAGVGASNTSGSTLPFSCCALTFACREHKHNQLLRLPSAKPLRSVPQSGAELVPPQIQRPRAARYACCGCQGHRRDHHVAPRSQCRSHTSPSCPVNGQIPRRGPFSRRRSLRPPQSTGRACRRSTQRPSPHLRRGRGGRRPPDICDSGQGVHRRPRRGGPRYNRTGDAAYRSAAGSP